MRPRPWSPWIFGFVLLLLAAWASLLAWTRIYQVDEAQNLYMTRVLATGQSKVFFTNALLWMVGPLSWVARGVSDSAAYFQAGRTIFLGVFFLNICLLALNTGARLRSAAGLAALLGAATLAPLWDYGFEIRHDNLILTGLLLLWWLGRTRPRGIRSFVLIGFLSVAMVFTAFKAFVYAAPLSLAFLLFPPPGHGSRRLPLVLGWLGGALAALLCVGLAYGISGTWTVFVTGFQGGLGATEGGARFGPWITLGRLFDQTPLLLGVSMGALASLGVQLSREGRAALTWEGAWPEALLLFGALFILLINPTPFPYNLVNLVPFAYLLAFRFASPLLLKAELPAGGWTLLLAVLASTHAAPFVKATWRHGDWPNSRQRLLMRTAEAMTDPKQDRVYDAIGMVPLRQSIGYYWYLHSLNLQAFYRGERPSLTRMLTDHPPAVLIASYRTDWLPESDHQFIASRYVPLADDFWVLGQVLPGGGGTYTVAHPGRYRILGLEKGRGVAPLKSVALDGATPGSNPVFLDLGPHRVSTPPNIQPVVVWVGPNLADIPQLGPGSRQHLFVNWY